MSSVSPLGIVSIYALHFLPSSISGNEVLFSLETASDYVKDEKACFYGFKCVAVGFEFNPGLDEVRKKILPYAFFRQNYKDEIMTALLSVVYFSALLMADLCPFSGSHHA